MSRAILERGYLLALFPDKKGVSISGNKYTPFIWRFINKNNSIVLDHKNDTKDTINFIELKNKEERNYLTADQRSIGKIELYSSADMLKNYKNDPFYPENNAWRIKPAVEENQIEILKRLGNYIRHYTYILKASLERNNEIISFTYSMGIIRIYSGAVGILETEQIPDRWFKCFYNKNQAMQAYEIYGELLTNSNNNGASSGEWVKDDYELLLNLYKDIQLLINQKEGNDLK